MLNDASEESMFEKVQRMQDRLVSQSTGGGFDGGDLEFKRLRNELLERPDIKEKLPDFVRRFRDLHQYWQFIKGKYGTYQERREFLWDSFRPGLITWKLLIERLARKSLMKFEEFNAEAVHTAWQKALDRRTTDPEGAITASRESVCKHILDDAGIDASIRCERLPRRCGSTKRRRIQCQRLSTRRNACNYWPGAPS